MWYITITFGEGKSGKLKVSGYGLVVVVVARFG